MARLLRRRGTCRSPRHRAPARIASRWLAVAALLTALTPATGSAQIGIFDALARRFSDVSFYGNIGGLAPSTPDVRADRLSAFGIEVLVSIGTITRNTGPAVRGDSAVLRWTGMQVVRRATGVDTINTYDVRPGTVRQPSEEVWSLELGLGYGQMAGFRSNVEQLDLRGSVRDLPTVSLYASYVPTGTYVGLRSGFMKLQALQLYHEDGRSWAGEADSFLGGMAVGQIIDLLNLSFFAEVGYAWRPFPSIRWTGGTLPATAPRELSLHSWTFGAGVQFALSGG
jgi:hypothetical protein